MITNLIKELSLKEGASIVKEILSNLEVVVKGSSTVYDIVDDGAIRFDGHQDLTESQKKQVSLNIGLPDRYAGEVFLTDRVTGKQYVLYVENGKLSMDEKIQEIIAAICGMTLCGQTVCGGA